MNRVDGLKLKISTSKSLTNWLQHNDCSLAFTTYQVGKVFMVGRNADNSIHITERSFPRCMGITIKGDMLWMSSQFQLWNFHAFLPPGKEYHEYDQVFVPQVAYTTGDLDVHDIIANKDGTPFFVNTAFNCIATISHGKSFKPIWKPDFISKLVPEDRCHLNGLAAVNGKPKYVTIVGKSDTAGGWRDLKKTGGLVVDIDSNEVVCEGLSMPHSPRLYQERLWLLEAGTGYFGYVDRVQKRFVKMTFLPGFVRGLAFVNNYAIVGLSKNRENKTFGGLALDDNLERLDMSPKCGVFIIDLKSGEIVHHIELAGVVKELYDVIILPGIRKPLVIGTIKDEIKQLISVEE